MNSFLSGFFNPLTCHALFAEKVHPSRDALVRVRSAFGNNAANLVTLALAGLLFLQILPEEIALVIIAADGFLCDDVDVENMSDGLIFLTAVAIQAAGDAFFC